MATELVKQTLRMKLRTAGTVGAALPHSIIPVDMGGGNCGESTGAGAAQAGVHPGLFADP